MLLEINLKIAFNHLEHCNNYGQSNSMTVLPPRAHNSHITHATLYLKYTLANRIRVSSKLKVALSALK